MEASRQAPALSSSAMAATSENNTASATAEAVRSQNRLGDPLKDVKPADKRSLDYLVRSGIAGGIAGCAVSSSLGDTAEESFSDPFLFLGKNCCRTT